ncbi:MAG: hypothetical protein CMO44_12870 [Verrucomicrobiales bacterium]|nr:hypothetical protein [Verrucomicrobiales bacterium]|tara:strand:+ start:2141 stop:2908 length:768 start_codon:yes stop_codon:yes gene_type:complete
MTPSEYRKYVENMYSKRMVTPKRRRSPSLRTRSTGKRLSAATYARAAKYDALQRASKKAVAFKIGKLARGKAATRRNEAFTKARASISSEAAAKARSRTQRRNNSAASKLQAQGRIYNDRRRASKAAASADAAAASRAASAAAAAQPRRGSILFPGSRSLGVKNEDEFRTFERHAERIAKDLETNEPVEFVEVDVSIEGGMRRRRKNRKSRGKKRSKSRSAGKRRSKSGRKSRSKSGRKSRSKGKRKMRGGRDSY